MPNLERNSWLPGWLSDLPRLWSRESHSPRVRKFRLRDPNVVAQINGLAKKNTTTEIQVVQSFFRAGLLTLVNNNTLVSHDEMGFEKPVSLMDEDFAPEQGGRNSRIRHKLIMPIDMVNYLTETANKYGVSSEELLIRICKLGIKIAQAKNNPDITYVLRKGSGEDIDFKDVNLFG